LIGSARGLEQRQGEIRVKFVLARVNKFVLAVTGMAVLTVVVTVFLWEAPSRQTKDALNGVQLSGPLTSRGYTDAPAGTAVIAGDAGGGSNLLELRVKEGQKVKRDEIIAVLSNYPKAEEALRKAEANQTTLKQQHDTVLMGTRVTNIALQEATLKSSIESDKLQTLQRARSGKPPKEKELEARLAEQSLEREKVSLAFAKQVLKNDLAQYEIDLATTQAQIDMARRNCEASLVRSPLDGVVVQIGTRAGERISGAGIAKIVDMSQLRVLADVSEDQVARLAPGGKVEITLRGNPTVYNGTIMRVASNVNRMQRVEPDGAASTDARVVQVEIQFDDPSSMPLVLGRETRVIYR
jgi:HlyD family secretion protein